MGIGFLSCKRAALSGLRLVILAFVGMVNVNGLKVARPWTVSSSAAHHDLLFPAGALRGYCSVRPDILYRGALLSDRPRLVR